MFINFVVSCKKQNRNDALKKGVWSVFKDNQMNIISRNQSCTCASEDVNGRRKGLMQESPDGVHDEGHLESSVST